jgi:hypothetical protein
MAVLMEPLSILATSHYYINDFTGHYQSITKTVTKYLRIFGSGHFIYRGGRKMTVSQNRFTEAVKSSPSPKIY